MESLRIQYITAPWRRGWIGCDVIRIVATEQVRNKFQILESFTPYQISCCYFCSSTEVLYVYVAKKHLLQSIKVNSHKAECILNKLKKIQFAPFERKNFVNIRSFRNSFVPIWISWLRWSVYDTVQYTYTINENTQESLSNLM